MYNIYKCLGWFREIFPYFWTESYIVILGVWQDGSNKGHNMRFCGEIWEI